MTKPRYFQWADVVRGKKPTEWLYLSEPEAIKWWNDIAKHCPEQMREIKSLDDLLPHQLKELFKSVRLTT